MSSGNLEVWSKRSKTWIRIGIVGFIVFFIWLQLNYMSSRGSSPESPPSSQISESKPTRRGLVPVELQKYLEGSKNVSSTPSISDIKNSVDQYNYQQVVYGEDKFGPLKNDSVVVVIQVHDRISYLRQLIVSLALAGDISQALLIFSHDYYDEEINDLIQSIDFCKVTQIFYPYSIQTHPDEFPGQDAQDCSRNMNKKLATTTKCNNAQFPDRHGHYREAKFTQTKHHWWWKINWVFGQLGITSSHSGLFLFIEEDHYLAEDFIHMLRLMESTCRESNKGCDIFSLAKNLKVYNLNQDSKKVEVTTWLSNMGMAFNRHTWMKIADCGNTFCKYDDYNWDWTLQYVSENCMKEKLVTMVARGPRLFHLGECGLHHKKADCNPRSVTQRVQETLKSAASALYPNDLTIISSITSKGKRIRTSNGGWADERDHKLCMGMIIT